MIHNLFHIFALYGSATLTAVLFVGIVTGLGRISK